MALAETESGRYAVLFQSLKDLKSAWNFDISAELEAYQQEMNSFLNGDGNPGHQLNFAEAALLVQGVANLYSRKVDSLYHQAFETLFSIGKDSGLPADVAKKHSKRATDVSENDDFRQLDNLAIHQGCSDLSDDTELFQASVRRVPLFLIPREGTDRNRHSFRVSSCIVDSAGMLIFPEVFGSKPHGDASSNQANEGVYDLTSTPLLLRAPPITSQVTERSPIVEESHQLEAGDDLETLSDRSSNESAVNTPMDPPSPSLSVSDNIITSSPDISSSSEEEDAHERLGSYHKVCVVSFHIHPSVTSAEYSDRGSRDIFVATNGAQSSARRKEQKQNDKIRGLLSAEAGSRRAVALRLRDNARVHYNLMSNTILQTDRENAQESIRNRISSSSASASSSDDLPPTRFSFAGSVSTDLLGNPENHDINFQPKGEYVDAIAAQTRDYDAMVRAKLEEALEGSGAGTADNFPDIYKTVKKWQDTLEPLLIEQNQRPPFDLGKYTLSILDQLKSDDRSFLKFEDLVAGKHQWDISRVFLSALILTNNGNIDILDDRRDNRQQFDLRLIDAERSLAYAVESSATLEFAPSSLPAPVVEELLVQPKRKRARHVARESLSDPDESDSDWISRQSS